MFINFSELYNAGGSFAKQEVVESTSNNTTTTTIYGGYAPVGSIDPSTDELPTWIIRRTIVVDNGTTQTITCAWAKGSWTNRASLEYSYHKP